MSDSAKKPKHFAYFAAQKKEEDRIQKFAYGDQEFINKTVDSWNEKNETPEAEDTEESTPDFTNKSALTDSLAKAVNFGLSQFHLIIIAVSVPDLFVDAFTSGRVVEPTIKDCSEVVETDGTHVCGLNEDQFLRLVERRVALEQVEQGLQALPSATLLSIVATFDTLIVDIMGNMLRLNREWLHKSEKSISLKRLADARSIDELVLETVSDELYQFSRGSHDEQAKYIETNFGIGIKGQWKRWADYIEVFERRNLIAHGERTFNKRYVNICLEAGHKGSEKVLGQEIQLTPAYLEQALDILLEFAILLTFSLWRKLEVGKTDDAFVNLNEAVFKLIENKRFTPAGRILEYALGLKKTGVSEQTRQMLVVNHASALRHSGNEEGAKNVLDTVDWSASSERFQICVASIKGDTQEVIRLMPIVKGAGTLNRKSFKRRPCFSFVREDEEVRACYERVFGEPLAIASPGSAAKLAGSLEAAAKPADEPDTLH